MKILNISSWVLSFPDIIKVTDDREDFENNNILEALDYIATNFVTNVRELEGSLNNVIAFSKINRVPILDLLFS